jgi:hypothetical protein
MVAIIPAATPRTAWVAAPMADGFRAGAVLLARRDAAARAAGLRRAAAFALLRAVAFARREGAAFFAAGRFFPPDFAAVRAEALPPRFAAARRVTVRFAVARFVFACFLDARLATQPSDSSSIH